MDWVTKFEIDWVISCPDSGRKLPLSVIFGPKEDQNWVNMGQKRSNSEHSPSKCMHQVWDGLID